jgi:hypothetical protein
MVDTKFVYKTMKLLTYIRGLMKSPIFLGKFGSFRVRNDDCHV